MFDILKQKGKAILLGNEAIVRGALEAGVQFVSTYPGTPASEIGDTLSKIQNQSSGESPKTSAKSKIQNLYFEYSPNEKTALEAGIGASFAGLKTLIAMKHFGLNVCSDSLLPFVYTGCQGGLVIIVGDDPGCHSSAQSEPDTRAFAKLAHIPILEPSDPREAKEFVKIAFKISEKYSLPVMIRITTRLAHQRQSMPLKKFSIKKPKAYFKKEFSRYVTLPPRVLEMKKELLEKIEKIRRISEKSKTNKVIQNLKHRTQSPRAGIITSGVSYLYVMEAQEKLKLNLPILKLGFFYPLPKKKIKNFIKGLEKVLVVEELEPYLEEKVAVLAKEANANLEILGKDILSKAKRKLGQSLPSIVGELRPEYVTSALAEISGKRYLQKIYQPIKKIKHIPRFCTGSGCPYWRLFAAIDKALKQASIKIKPENIVFGGDIGCYMMAGLPHTKKQDYLLNMGSSVGIAHGLQKALSQSSQQKVIALIGDSTFFHAGIPALINTSYNQSNPLIIICDNRITAMTGQQPNPGMGQTGMGKKVPEIKIEDIARACGVKWVKVIDQEKEFEKLVAVIQEFLAKDEVALIVARHTCWLYEQLKKQAT